MTRIREPFTLPKHPELLRKINEMNICIEVHYLIKNEDVESTSALARAQLEHDKPTWEDVVKLLTEARIAIDQQREDPRKY